MDDMHMENPYVYIIPLHPTRPEFDELPEEIETHVGVANITIDEDDEL